MTVKQYGWKITRSNSTFQIPTCSLPSAQANAQLCGTVHGFSSSFYLALLRIIHVCVAVYVCVRICVCVDVCLVCLWPCVCMCVYGVAYEGDAPCMYMQRLQEDAEHISLSFSTALPGDRVSPWTGNLLFHLGGQARKCLGFTCHIWPPILG